MTFEQVIENQTGYKCKTTFAMDFAIAERFGADAIKDTFDRSFKNWKTNITYFTELTMIINWKIWQWYKTNEKFAKLYEECYYKCCEYADENLQGEDAKYFYSTLD